jgi:hypothetical protein
LDHATAGNIRQRLLHRRYRLVYFRTLDTSVSDRVTVTAAISI